jgi:hypothetical protein
VDELVDVSDLRQPVRFLRRFLRYRARRGEMNTIVARKPVGLDVPSTAENFSAEVALAGPWRESPTPNERLLPVNVTNTGRAFWPTAKAFPFPHGAVTVGLYTMSDAGERVELTRTMLPHGVSPGQTVHVLLPAPADVVSGREVRVDVVREGLDWFADLGSEPLIVPAEG